MITHPKLNIMTMIIIDLHNFTVSKSLKKVIKKNKFIIKVNNDFKGVLKIDLDSSFKEKFGFPTDAVRNEGVKLATGKYVAFLDDDDIWLKNKLTIQVEKMESTNLKFSSTEGYFGEGVFNRSKNYELYNSEKFYKKIRKRYKGSKFYRSFDRVLWSIEVYLLVLVGLTGYQMVWGIMIAG